MARAQPAFPPPPQPSRLQPNEGWARLHQEEQRPVLHVIQIGQTSRPLQVRERALEVRGSKVQQPQGPEDLRVARVIAQGQ